MGLFGSGTEIPEGGDTLTEDEHAVLAKLAKKTVEKGMTVPAILFLESIKPLNFITAQTLVFFEPIVQSVFNFRDYDICTQTLSTHCDSTASPAIASNNEYVSCDC